MFTSVELSEFQSFMRFCLPQCYIHNIDPFFTPQKRHARNPKSDLTPRMLTFI